MRVVAFAGRPGAGKSEAVAAAAARRVPVVRMGDEVRAEAERRAIPLTDQGLGTLGTAEREKNGPDVWARRTCRTIRRAHADAKLLVIDGIRSMDEVARFRAELGDDFELVAVAAPAALRDQRLQRRGRPDAPKDAAAFRARDEREAGWGLDDVLKRADRTVSNDGSLADLRAKVNRLLDDLEVSE